MSTLINLIAIYNLVYANINIFDTYNKIYSLYNEYVANGGNAVDVEAVAKYVTENAPISSNWQEMFKEEINSTYGEKISKVEYLEGDLYTAYVIKDGKEVPYVTVNARTGYFHG